MNIGNCLKKIVVVLLSISMVFASVLISAYCEEISEIDNEIVNMIDCVFTKEPNYQIIDQNGYDIAESIIAECADLYEAHDYVSIACLILDKQYIFVHEEDVDETVGGISPYGSVNTTKQFSKSLSQIIDLRPYGGSICVFSYKLTGSYVCNVLTAKIVSISNTTLSFNTFNGGTQFTGSANNVSTGSYINSNQTIGTFTAQLNFVVKKCEPSTGAVVATYTFGPYKHSYNVTP